MQGEGLSRYDGMVTTATRAASLCMEAKGWAGGTELGFRHGGADQGAEQAEIFAGDSVTGHGGDQFAVFALGQKASMKRLGIDVGQQFGARPPAR